MKVAILCPSFFTFSGIDRMAEEQAKSLAEKGDEITIFSLAADMTPPESVNLLVLGMPNNILSQRLYRLLFPLDFIKTMRWVPKLKGFNVIYSHQYPMNWLAYLAKKRYGIKYIYYNYGYAPPDKFSNLIERTYWRIIIFLANWTIKKADGAISISKYLQQELKRETNIESEVVYCNIDTKRFHKGIDGSAIRKRYNLADAPIILFVGRISPHKGIHLLIESFSLVRQHLPGANLIILGKHSFAGYSKRLKQISNDSVIFVEDVSDDEIPMYYATCDVYATATLWEGFDLPLAEAQACGKPVVAFDIGPHPEVVKDGKTGKLVPAGNTTAMAAAILSFLKGQSK